MVCLLCFAVPLQACTDGGARDGTVYTGFLEDASGSMHGDIHFFTSKKATLVPSAGLTAMQQKWHSLNPESPLHALGFREWETSPDMLRFRGPTKGNVLRRSLKELTCRVAGNGAGSSSSSATAAHRSLSYKCGPAASSHASSQQRFKRRYGGSGGNPWAAGALVSGGNPWAAGALVPSSGAIANPNAGWLATMPGSGDCSVSSACGSTCKFVNGLPVCTTNVKSGSGSGSGSGSS